MCRSLLTRVLFFTVVKNLCIWVQERVGCSTLGGATALSTQAMWTCASGIDLAGSSRFWQTVRQAETLSPINVLPGEGEQFALRTEQFPVAPVMAPGEMLAIVEQVLQDCEANTENDPSIMRQYRYLLLDLVHDWREIWSLHGFTEVAFPEYRKVLERTASQLLPNPRCS